MLLQSIVALRNQDKNFYAVLLLLGTVFLNPFPHTTFFVQLFFYLAFILSLLILKNDHRKFYCKSPLLYPLSLLFFWAVASVIFALDQSDSARDLYSHLIRYLILYVLLINFFSTKEKLVLLSIAVILSEFIFLVGTFIYYYGILGYDISSRFTLRLSSIAVDIIPFGLILGGVLAAWLIQLQKRQFVKFLWIGAAFILLASSLLTHSKGALLSLIFSMLILLWQNKKILLVILMIVSIVILQTPFKERLKPGKLIEDKPRKALIFYALEIMKDYPIFGTGFSLDTFRDNRYIDQKNYVSRIPEEYRDHKNFFWPHNMFLFMGVRTGVVGMIIYAAIFVVSILTSIKLIRYGQDDYIRSGARCCLALMIMFLVNGMVQPIFVHFVDTIFYIILALITILWKIDRDKSESIIGTN